MVVKYLITTKTLTTKKLFFVKFQAPFSQKIINIQLNISCTAFMCSIVWVWWLPNDIYYNNQSPHWKTVLFVETTKLFISNSIRVYTDTFIDTLSQGWGFWLPVLFRGEDFCAQWLSREKGFAAFKSCPGFVRGGGALDEIDTCISHCHVKSDMARPTSVDQVIRVSLKMCSIFSITKQLWIKTILSVVQLIRLCQCSPAGRSFPGKERYCGEI